MGKERHRPPAFAEKIKDLLGIDSRKLTRYVGWCCEWVVYWLGGLAFLELLEYVGKLGILIAIITWFLPGCHDRKQAVIDSTKSRHYVAWQTINSAMGKPGNAGRNDALQDLVQDGVRLDGISLAGGAVITGPLNLSGAEMTHADFSDGTYENVNFSRANFDFSKWDHALSEYCNFQESSFWAANFKNSTFYSCDFGYADDGKKQHGALFQTQFSGNRIDFNECNFAGAAFPLNIWDSAHFFGCNLAYTDLRNIHFNTQNTDVLFCCNLYGATASPETIKWASHLLLAFTNITSLEQWQHCSTNGPVVHFQKCGPDFMNWASNQFSIFNQTNDVQAWLQWSRENLQK